MNSRLINALVLDFEIYYSSGAQTESDQFFRVLRLQPGIGYICYMYCSMSGQRIIVATKIRSWEFHSLTRE